MIESPFVSVSVSGRTRVIRVGTGFLVRKTKAADDSSLTRSSRQGQTFLITNPDHTYQGATMKRLHCMREYVDALKALGEIQEIDVEVDWNLEMGAIIRRSYELKAPAPLFNRIKDIEPGFRVLGAPAGVSKQLGLVRIALSLGLPADGPAQSDRRAPGGSS